MFTDCAEFQDLIDALEELERDYQPLKTDGSGRRGTVRRSVAFRLFDAVAALDGATVDVEFPASDAGCPRRTY